MTKTPIISCLWYAHNALEAAEFYTTLFTNSHIGSKLLYTEVGKEIHGQEPGSLLTVDFTLAGIPFCAMNGGDTFTLNPSISLTVTCESLAEIESLWSQLSKGGQVLMEYSNYPFAYRYGWVIDRFGLSWQLSLQSEQGPSQPIAQKIMPSLLFVGQAFGKVRAALDLYTSVFEGSQVVELSEYGEAASNPDEATAVQWSQFELGGTQMTAMENSFDHKFAFNEAFSFIVECDTQEEIDHYWSALSAVPEAEQCGWLKDRFGVSWQIVPKNMNTYFEGKNGDTAFAAMMEMKKLIFID